MYFFPRVTPISVALVPSTCCASTCPSSDIIQNHWDHLKVPKASHQMQNLGSWTANPAIIRWLLARQSTVWTRKANLNVIYKACRWGWKKQAFLPEPIELFICWWLKLMVVHDGSWQFMGCQLCGVHTPRQLPHDSHPGHDHPRLHHRGLPEDCGLLGPLLQDRTEGTVAASDFHRGLQCLAWYTSDAIGWGQAAAWTSQMDWVHPNPDTWTTLRSLGCKTRIRAFENHTLSDGHYFLSIDCTKSRVTRSSAVVKQWAIQNPFIRLESTPVALIHWLVALFIPWSMN